MLEEFGQKVDDRLSRYDAMPVKYANLWSRLLFGRAFKLQFPIPIPQPGWMKGVLGAWEKQLTPPDLDSMPIEKPIFIVGLPRSGTTLLHYLLCAHERAAYLSNVMNTLPDTILAIERARKLLGLNIWGDRHLKDSIEVDFTSPTEPIMHWGIWTGQDLYDLAYRSITPDAASVARMKRDIRKVQLSSGAPRPRFVCKYPYFSMQMPMLEKIFPDAKFIHIVRDPQAVTQSMIKLYLLIEHQRLLVEHPTVKTLIPYPRTPSLAKLIAEHGPEDVRTTATVWKETIEAVRRDSPGLRNFHEVRHEDLVADPKRVFDGILKFCELESPAPGNTKFRGEFAKIGKLRHENSYAKSTAKAKSDQALVREITGDVARHYGY